LLIIGRTGTISREKFSGPDVPVTYGYAKPRVKSHVVAVMLSHKCQ